MYHQQLFASGETIREQKDEIARLQAEIVRLHGANERLRAEIERLRAMAFNPVTLTDAEREAVAWAVSAAEDCQHPADDALRGLLERTK